MVEVVVVVALTVAKRVVMLTKTFSLLQENPQNNDQILSL